MLDVTRQPDNNILYVAYKGKITDDDYEKVLIPALEAALKDYDKIRLLVQMGEDFDVGFDNGADPRALDLDGHIFTAFEARPVNLADRRGRERSTIHAVSSTH